MNKQEIIAFEKKISPAIVLVQKLHIKNKQDMNEAVQTLSLINKYADHVKEKRETITKPLNEALKNARTLFKPIESKLDGAITLIREEMSRYQTEETTKQQAEEAKIIDRVGDGKGKLKLETAVKKIENLGGLESVVTTDAGKVKFREDKVLKITDEMIIPRQFLNVNEKALIDALKMGMSVPGATLETKLVPLNYR